jgi:hypothetical protein
MGEPENRRQREAMRAALAPHVSEEVLLGEWFVPAKGMEDDGLAAFRWLRRAGSSGEHAADRIRGRNILALTPTRLLAFTGRSVRSTPPVVPKKLIGDWPLREVGLEYKGRKATSYFAHAGGSYTSRIVRATLTLTDDDRPLVIDFPDTPLARELLKAAKAAIDASRA